MVKLSLDENAASQSPAERTEKETRISGLSGQPITEDAVSLGLQLAWTKPRWSFKKRLDWME